VNYKLGRIKKRFELLKSSKEKGLITFVTAGDPDYNTSLSIIKRLPDAGADLIEIGMPFSNTKRSIVIRISCRYKGYKAFLFTRF
jgi:tryptophan synthase alpha subunit